jgi:hypothetical protein
MSVSSYLMCPARGLMLGLGKRLRDPEGGVIGFSIGDRFSSEDPELAWALWAFLADTAGEELVVKFSDDKDFETIARNRVIGGDAYDDIPFEDYRRDRRP